MSKGLGSISASLIAAAAVLCFLAGYCTSKESYWRGRWDQASGVEAKGWLRE